MILVLKYACHKNIPCNYLILGYLLLNLKSLFSTRKFPSSIFTLINNKQRSNIFKNRMTSHLFTTVERTYILVSEAS